MTSLHDAVEAMDQRKRAVFDDSRTLDRQESRFMLSGTDLDLDEVTAMSMAVWFVMTHHPSFEGMSEEERVRGSWVDGLLTGVMYARLQQKERKS